MGNGWKLSPTQGGEGGNSGDGGLARGREGHRRRAARANRPEPSNRAKRARGPAAARSKRAAGPRPEGWGGRCSGRTTGFDRPGCRSPGHRVRRFTVRVSTHRRPWRRGLRPQFARQQSRRPGHRRSGRRGLFASPAQGLAASGAANQLLQHGATPAASAAGLNPLAPRQPGRRRPRWVPARPPHPTRGRGDSTGGSAPGPTPFPRPQARPCNPAPARRRACPPSSRRRPPQLP